MKITIEKLMDKGACHEGKEWFVANFPEDGDSEMVLEKLMVQGKWDWTQWVIKEFRLANVTIPGSVTNIWGGGFYYCCSLVNVTISNGLDAIPPFMFYHCSNLSKVIIPDSVTSIGNCAFNGCINLTSIKIPASVTSIGRRAFLQSCKIERVE